MKRPSPLAKRIPSEYKYLHSLLLAELTDRGLEVDLTYRVNIKNSHLTLCVRVNNKTLTPSIVAYAIAEEIQRYRPDTNSIVRFDFLEINRTGKLYSYYKLLLSYGKSETSSKLAELIPHRDALTRPVSVTHRVLNNN